MLEVSCYTVQSVWWRTWHVGMLRDPVVNFTLSNTCLVAKPLDRSEAKVTLLWYKTCCFSNVDYFVIMLTRNWSLSKQGHLQPHSIHHIHLHNWKMACYVSPFLQICGSSILMIEAYFEIRQLRSYWRWK